MVPFTFRAIEELELGPKWAGVFEARWPHYRDWFLREGEAARPSYATSVRMLRAHMPELVSAYERVVELAGGGDLAARMLALYKPPPYLAACSQGVWTGEGGPVLARNYDYAPSRFEGLVWSTHLLERRVIGTSDCLWGLLDGINDAGLAVSLTFGGRRDVGDGFGIPLVVRYLLETCDSVEAAREALERIPVHAAQNLTLLDRSGTYLTAYVGPGRPPEFHAVAATTNHQGKVEWPEYARAIRTVEREQRVLELLADPALTRERFVEAFLEPPLHNTEYGQGFGTIYTAAYHPAEGRAEYRWPGFTWERSLDRFEEAQHTETFAAATRS